MPLDLLAPPVVEAPPPTSTTPALRPARVLRWLGREHVLVLATAAVGYVALGLWLVLARHVILIDALARVGNASYVVSGREPHLAAIGFVWNPLPSLAMVPLVLLRSVAPVLVELGLAATLTTAVVMAAAVQQLHGLLRDAGLARPARLLMTLAFAANPMIAYYGANGMSEAWLVLAMAWAARRLAGWLRTGRTGDLVGCSVALSVGYLARYEAIAAIAAVSVVVLVHSWARAGGSASHRRLLALNDTVLVALPATVAVVAWALLSWVIVGHPFETFQSPYGNSAQVDLANRYIASSTGSDATARLAYVGEQLLWLAPCLAAVVLLALVTGVTRRGRSALAPLACFGSVLCFQAAAFVHGDTFGWLRFSICAVPLAVALAGTLAALPRTAAVRIATGALAVGVAVSSAITGWHPVLDHRLGREESAVLLPVLDRARASAADRATLHRFENERAIARWLDAQHLPEGSVLVDTAPGFAIVLASRHPKQFVITSDTDFEATVADPSLSDVRYVLVQPTPQDAFNIAYPDVYDTGRPFLRLVRAFPARGVGVPWRVYAVTQHF